MNKIEDLRESFKSLNKKHISARLAKSSLIEDWIRDTMNHHGIPYEGKMLHAWNKCDSKDDRKYKRDAFHDHEGRLVYSQIKWRQPDSGGDVEAAIIQPYYDLPTFKKIVQDEPEKLADHVWARDYKFDGQFYCVLNRGWEILRVIPNNSVKKRINAALRGWWKSDQNLKAKFGENTFHYQDGIQLKCTSDKGFGSYDSGLQKILIYIPISAFENKDVFSVEMIEPPRYLWLEMVGK